jgi:hypothetical protein
MSFQIINKGKKYEGFNHGLGKAFTGERQMREYLTRLEGETGKKLVEMGNDNPMVTQQRGTYRISEKEMREIHNRLGDAGVPS